MLVTQLHRRQTAVSIAEGDYGFIAAVSLKVAQVPPHVATGVCIAPVCLSDGAPVNCALLALSVQLMPLSPIPTTKT